MPWGDDPTTADYAMATANDLKSRVAALEKRVSELEARIEMRWGSTKVKNEETNDIP